MHINDYIIIENIAGKDAQVVQMTDLNSGCHGFNSQHNTGSELPKSLFLCSSYGTNIKSGMVLKITQLSDTEFTGIGHLTQ